MTHDIEHCTRCNADLEESQIGLCCDCQEARERTDTLYFATHEQAKGFAIAMLHANREVHSFYEDDDTGFHHGVTYSGPRVTMHSTFIGSTAGRYASRFLDRE